MTPAFAKHSRTARERNHALDAVVRVALAASSLAAAFHASAAPPHYQSPHWVLDARYHHDHYYPAHGYVVAALPAGHVPIAFRGVNYYYHGGVWFRAVGPRFSVVIPPIGIVVPFLPVGYATVWWGGAPYYYANEVYYQAAPSGGYQVVAPPPANEVTLDDPAKAPPAPVAAAPDTPLFVYPRNGQNEKQIEADRADCGRWATGQSGYDPAKGNDATRRADYQRALSACLEGRGYTVK